MPTADEIALKAGQDQCKQLITAFVSRIAQDVESQARRYGGIESFFALADQCGNPEDVSILRSAIAASKRIKAERLAALPRSQSVATPTVQG